MTETESQSHAFSKTNFKREKMIKFLRMHKQLFASATIIPLFSLLLSCDCTLPATVHFSTLFPFLLPSLLPLFTPENPPQTVDGGGSGRKKGEGSNPRVPPLEGRDAMLMSRGGGGGGKQRDPLHPLPHANLSPRPPCSNTGAILWRTCSEGGRVG